MTVRPGQSRRDFLRGAGAGAAVLAGAGLLDACASSSHSPVAATSRPRRGGTLRIGCTGGASSDTLNPLAQATNPDLVREPLLFDCLVQFDENAIPALQLAEQITPNQDATAWDIRIRDGVEFHNGKTMTAADVLYTFTQILNPQHPLDGASSLAFIDLKSTRVIDDRTLRVACHRPVAPFVEALATCANSAILPAGFNPAAPVGTGPFRYESFTPGVQSTFQRNPNYWRVGLPYLDAVSVIDFADDTSQINALQSGQIDAIAFLEAVSVNLLKSAGYQAQTSAGGFWNPFTMRVDKPPFDDVRVRQAFRLMVDRQQMRDVVYGGYGAIGNDLFAPWDPEYDARLPQRAQDLDQAKFLLKQAGAENLRVTLVTSPIANGIVDAATVFARQASGAGVTVTVDQVPTSTFYGPNYLQWTFAQDVWDYNPFWSQVAATTLPGSSFNETHYSDPRYAALYDEGLKTLDKAKRSEIATELQQIQYEEGGYIVPVIVPNLSACSPSVSGLGASKCGLPFNSSDLTKAWIS